MSKRLKCLVTGFGNFNDSKANPSWLITKEMPSSLLDSNIDIFYYEQPISVDYSTVTETVEKIWDPLQAGVDYDFAIHIGMAGDEKVYRLERLAHHDGYKHKGVDGKLLEESKVLPGWNDMPEVLETAFDVESVFESWKKHKPSHADVKISDDPGRFLCDFIYYSSMATLESLSRKRTVIFLHVPKSYADEDIAIGRDIVLALIRSLADTLKNLRN